MADLSGNITYGTPQNSVPNISKLVRNLTPNVQKTMGSNVSSAIASHFNPANAYGNNTQAPVTSTVPGTPLPQSAFNPANAYGTSPNVSDEISRMFAAGALTLPGNAPIVGQTQSKFESIPDYEKFLPTDPQGKWVAPSDQAVLRNWPTDLGGGQYVTDPTQPGKLIKSDRVLVDSKLDPGFQQKVLGGLSGKLFQIDHIVPLWAGGADTATNLQVLDLPTHQNKTNVQAVALTLLANGKIDFDQAKLMALTYKEKDGSGLANADEHGYVPLAMAEKYAKKWEDDMKPSFFRDVKKYFGESFKENMQNFGKDIPIVGEFAKGLVGGGTAGLVPGTTPREDANTLDKLANFGGNLVGTLTGMGIAGKVLGRIGLFGQATKAASVPLLEYEGYGKAMSAASEAAKTAGLVSNAVDYGLQSPGKILVPKIMSQMAKNVGLFTLWNNVIGIGGRELTGQQPFDIQTHMHQFYTDLAYGTLLGNVNQSIRGYAGVGLGSTAIALIAGEPIEEALKNGALMTALHTMGYTNKGFDAKGKAFSYSGELNRIASDQAYKMSTVAFDQYGQPVPTVKVGQAVPEMLQFEPQTIAQLKAEYKQKHPNDTRFDNLENTNSGGAVQLMSRNAREKLMDLVMRSDGAISQDQVKQELTRLTTSENQLYNQTLPPEERVAKQTKDLITTAQKLKPKTEPAQTQFVTNSSEIFNKVDFKNVGEFPNGENFTLRGPFTPVGYAYNLDVQGQQTVHDMAKNQNKYMSFVVGVNDGETINFQKLVNQKIAENPTKNYPNGPTGDPNDTVRFFALEKGENGELIPKPFAYMPKEESYTKANNVNKTQEQITKRLFGIIELAKNPKEVQKYVEADKSVNDKGFPHRTVDIETATKLFEGKGKMTEEEMYNILKPQNAHVKYDQNLNTKTVASEMRNNGKNYVIADISKNWLINGREYYGDPRHADHPFEPFIELTFTNQKPEVQQTVPFRSDVIPEVLKQNAKKENTQKVTNTIGEVLKKNETSTPEETPVVNGFTKEEIKSMKKQGFSDTMIQHLATQKIKQNQVVETYKPEDVSKPEIQTTPDVVTRLSKAAAKEYPSVSDIHKIADEKGIFWDNDATFMNLTKRITGKEHLDILNGNQRKLMHSYLSNQPVQAPRTTVEASITQNTTKVPSTDTIPLNTSTAPAFKKPDLVNEFYQDMVGRIEDVKPDISSPETHELSLTDAIRNFRPKNPGLSKVEFKNMLNQAKGRAQAYVGDIIENAYKGTKIFGTADESWVHQPIVDKTPQPDHSVVLAKKYGLELTTPNEAGKQFLKLDRSGNPTFINPNAPRVFLESAFNADLKSYKANLSKNSVEWAKGLEEMKKTNNPYGKTFATTLDTILKEKFGGNHGDYSKSWKLNPALRNFNNESFTLSNEEGYSKSEPFRAIAVKNMGKNPTQIEKSLAAANAKTKAISEQARIARSEAVAKDSEALTIGKGETEGMNGRVVDPNQMINVAQDVTPFDLMMNGIENANAREKLVTQYNTLRKDIGGRSSQNVPQMTEQMKLLFEKIKAHSANIPEETKNWKLGSQIVLKNGGEPTPSEAIKDAFNVGMKIISQSRKSPGSIKFEDIRNKVLEQMKIKP